MNNFFNCLQRDLENHMKETSERLKMLFKFAQGSAHVWDVHEIGLAKQERALQEKLEQCRQVHDNQNQVQGYQSQITGSLCRTSIHSFNQLLLLVHGTTFLCKSMQSGCGVGWRRREWRENGYCYPL